MKVSVALLLLISVPSVLAERTRAVTPVPTVWVCTSFSLASDASAFAIGADGFRAAVRVHESRFLIFSTLHFLAWPSVYRDYVPFADVGECGGGVKFSVVRDPAHALALYSSKTLPHKGLVSYGDSWVVWWDHDAINP